MVTINPTDLMRLEDAARYLNVNVVTMRNLQRFRKLPFAKIGGKIMFRQKDIDAFVESQMTPAGPK